MTRPTPDPGPLALAAIAILAGWTVGHAGPAPAEAVPTAALKAEVDAFFDREVPAHLMQIPAEGPLPDRVHGALTTGEFSWGTFVRALAAYADSRHSRLVGGRDVVPLVARVGVAESAKGSKAFAQLYAALALRHFGADLARNAVWQSLSDRDRLACRALLDPTRFYDPKARVWLVRQGPLRFALPITTGTRPAIADYLPAPHGLPGFAAPVEQTVPAGASFFEMPDGRTLAATDGADEIAPGADGRSLRVAWRRVVAVGDRTGALIEPGFGISIVWRLEGATLTRAETLTSTRDITIRRLSWLLSSTATEHSQRPAAQGPASSVRLSGPEGVLDARVDGDVPIATSIQEIGDEPIGRGPRLPIPTHVTFEAKDIQLRAGQPWKSVISLTASPDLGAGRAREN